MIRPWTTPSWVAAAVLAILCVSCADRPQGSKGAAESGAAHPEEPHEAHGEEAGGSGNRVEMSAEMRAASGIEVQSAGPRPIRLTLDLPGEVVPNADRLAHIVPRFPGIARRVLKSVGQEVREGEVLAVIEGNQSLSTYEVASLLSGTVIERHVTLGEFVRDDSDIFVVADLSTVWVNVSVYSRDLARVRRGQTAVIQAVGSQGSGTGTIDYVGPVVGEATRAAGARVVLANAKRQWRPGTFVTAHVVVDEHRAAVAVPNEALQRLEGHDHLFVEVDGGFVARPVTRGATDGEWAEILSGLRPGERYAARGGFILKSELQKSEAGHDH